MSKEELEREIAGLEEELGQLRKDLTRYESAGRQDMVATVSNQIDAIRRRLSELRAG